MVITIFLGIGLGKLLKMDKDLSLLTATGSAICGAAAVLGAESVVKPQAYKTAVAVSTVVIFGTIAMFVYPALYNAGLLGLNEAQMGIYTGSQELRQASTNSVRPVPSLSSWLLSSSHGLWAEAGSWQNILYLFSSGIMFAEISYLWKIRFEISIICLKEKSMRPDAALFLRR